jgi:hypothetical protein
MHSHDTVGLDIAKSVFQIHGVDTAGNVGLRFALHDRSPRTSCASGPASIATSSSIEAKLNCVRCVFDALITSGLLVGFKRTGQDVGDLPDGARRRAVATRSRSGAG